MGQLANVSISRLTNRTNAQFIQSAVLAYSLWLIG